MHIYWNPRTATYPRDEWRPWYLTCQSQKCVTRQNSDSCHTCMRHVTHTIDPLLCSPPKRHASLYIAFFWGTTPDFSESQKSGFLTQNGFFFGFDWSSRYTANPAWIVGTQIDWMSHVTCECATSHSNAPCHIQIRHVAYEWVVSHTCTTHNRLSSLN